MKKNAVKRFTGCDCTRIRNDNVYGYTGIRNPGGTTPRWVQH